MEKGNHSKMVELAQTEVDMQHAGQGQQEQQGQTDAGVSAETLLKEKIEKLKLETMAKVNSMVDNQELLEKLRGIIEDTVNEAVAIGQVSAFPIEKIEHFTGSLKDTFERAVNPGDAHRASKYKQLYYNHRLAFSHLLSALQFVDSQAGVYEIGEEPFASPMSKMMGGNLDTVLGL